MNISNNISSIQSQQMAFDKSAQNVSKAAFNPQVDLSKEFSDQIVLKAATEANVSTIKSADGMLGSLLDLKA